MKHAPSIDHSAAMTPMMAQYMAIKAAHSDSLLFYRMGDFYELFFDDAVAAAAALDITLTKRGKHNGQDIPMCGVPVHAAETYLSRLILKGFKVAIAEQTEDPAVAKKRKGKTLVGRDVVRMVTPGTLSEDTLLDARRNNYLLAVAGIRDAIALAWVDMSTGLFCTMPSAADRLAADLAGLEPGEVLIAAESNSADFFAQSVDTAQACVTRRADSEFDSRTAEMRLCQYYGVDTLQGLGQFSRVELAAAGALLHYLEQTQKGHMPYLAPLQQRATRDYMIIDAATRRNLELTRTLSGETKGSFLHTIDCTVTGAGARLLARRLAEPLCDTARIQSRLHDVDFLIGAPDLLQSIRKQLRQAPDLERALTRLSLARGGPRDLAAIRDGLAVGIGLRNELLHQNHLPTGLQQATQRLTGNATLVDHLRDALSDTLPHLVRDGQFIAKGYRAELDELRMLRDESRQLIAALEQLYRGETDIDSLKIRHNHVLGYYIEVPARRADRLMVAPLNEQFIHRQTMANAVRFSSVKLSELEQQMARAGDQTLALELELFEQLVAEILAQAAAVAGAAEAIAEIDVATGNAELALRHRYCRPIVDDSLEFAVTGGRHPVVEASLHNQRNQPSSDGEGRSISGTGQFVSNPCHLNEDSRIWLVTGPNMAGKSTYLRQNALIAILAQMGSYVPADTAHIGAVDRVFSRVGAADDLASGRSTFMVEMVETAVILNQSTARSFVILDEIGRGTATFDGLSIAWSALEYLHEENRCRTLFATHYHELTALSRKLDGLKNVTIRVKEWNGKVVFLHEVVEGAADRSYGIQVAKLAGLPGAVVRRAETVLKALEANESSGSGKVEQLVDDLPLFAAARPKSVTADTAPSAVEAALKTLKPDEMSPRQALDALYHLSSLLPTDDH